MDKILEDLKISTKQDDLLTDDEREYENKVISTFEHIAEHNTTKSVKFILEITAEELGITPLELSEILDKHYAKEDDE